MTRPRRVRTLQSRPAHRPSSPSGRGTVLVAVVAALVLLQLLVVALTLGGPRDHDLTVRRIDSARAFYAAEGVMNMSLRELCLATDEDADGVVGGIASDTPTDPLPTGDPGGTGLVVVTFVNGQTLCIAEGRRGSSVHRIECIVE